jgi:hypothetical protein
VAVAEADVECSANAAASGIAMSNCALLIVHVHHHHEAKVGNLEAVLVVGSISLALEECIGVVAGVEEG